MGKRKVRKKKRAAAPVDPALLEEVARLEAAADVAGLRALTGAARSAARGALHRLREAGVEVPREPRRAVWQPSAAEVPPSVLSVPDAGGQALVWLVRADSSGGLALAQAVLRDGEEVLGLDVGHMSRSGWRDLRQQMAADRDELPCCELTGDEVAAILAGALTEDPSSEQVRASLTDLAPLLSGAEPPSGTHPVYALVDEDPDDGPVDGGPDVLDIEPLPRWTPPREAFAALLHELSERAGGLVVLSPAQEAATRETTIDGAVDTCFSDRDRWRRRLEDTARVLGELGRLDDARRLLAAARTLAGDGAPSAIPWCRALFTDRLEELAPDEPDEPARTESGLYLP